MATGDVSVQSVSGMVWLAGLAPGVLGFQWQVSSSLWSKLLDVDPHGVPALTLRRDGHGAGAPGSGALVMLDREPSGFRRIAVGPGVYRGDFGWLCRSGELLVLATVGPAAPPPARPADDPSLILIHPSVTTRAANAPCRTPTGAPPIVRIRAPQTFPRVRVAPASVVTDANAVERGVAEAGSVQTWPAVDCDPPLQSAAALDTLCESWRASGAHSLPPEVGWPEPGPLRPAGAA